MISCCFADGEENSRGTEAVFMDDRWAIQVAVNLAPGIPMMLSNASAIHIRRADHLLTPRL